MRLIDRCVSRKHSHWENYNFWWDKFSFAGVIKALAACFFHRDNLSWRYAHLYTFILIIQSPFSLSFNQWLLEYVHLYRTFTWFQGLFIDLLEMLCFDLLWGPRSSRWNLLPAELPCYCLKQVTNNIFFKHQKKCKQISSSWLNKVVLFSLTYHITN